MVLTGRLEKTQPASIWFSVNVTTMCGTLLRPRHGYILRGLRHNMTEMLKLFIVIYRLALVILLLALVAVFFAL
jgi:hypothetical protein